MSAGLYRYDDLRPQRGRPPQAGAVTVDGRDGTVHAGNVALGRTAEAVVITHNTTVDAVFAAYLRAHGFGGRLRPVLTPHPSTYCPVDGTRDCRSLGQARQWVGDRLRDHPGLPMQLVPGELDDSGQAVDQRSQHAIVVCEQLGVDWRRSARVRIAWTVRPYLDVFSEPWPDPAIPHREPPLPQPTVATPRAVHRWFDAEVAAGRIVLAAALPDPAARRLLREHAGLSLQAAAGLAGVSTEAVRLWETGEREPHGANRDRYLELLGEWRSGGQERADGPASAAQATAGPASSDDPGEAANTHEPAQQPEQEPDDGDPDNDPPEVAEMLREATAAAEDAGRQLTRDDYQAARAAAYRRHHDRMRSIAGR